MAPKTCHDDVMGRIKRLQDVYRFPGFVPLAQVRGVFGDPRAVVITLCRRRKKRAAASADELSHLLRSSGRDECATSPVATSASISTFDSPGPVLAVRRREDRRTGLAGRQPAVHQAVCLLRGPTLPGDAPSRRWPRNCFLDWHTVKELDKQYMREQLRRAGSPAPRVIGIDEISVGKGTVSHRGQRPGAAAGPSGSAARTAPRPAWTSSLPGSARKNAGKIRLAVMDMWKAFRNSTLKEGNAPQAGSCTTSSTSCSTWAKAMDKVRKREYARLSGKDRRFIKGQRYTFAVALGESHYSRESRP